MASPLPPWITLCCLLLLLVEPPRARALNVSVTWSPSGVTQYRGDCNASTVALEVNLGDVLLLSCQSHSNVIRETLCGNYESCNSAQTNTSKVIGSCSTTSSELRVPILQTSGHLDSAISYTPGSTYYLMSYSTGADLVSAWQNTTEGGECLEGLRMRLYIIPTATTQPPTTATTSSPDTTTPTRAGTTPPATTATTSIIDPVSADLGIGGAATPTSLHFVGFLLTLTASLLITLL